jgi:type II secretory pathway pseudopilin PulG
MDPRSSCSLRRAPRRAGQGFTAVEILLVLFVLALGAALAVVGFRRAVVHARIAEATGMLSDIASKEQAFFAGGGRYLTLRADGHTDPSGADEAAAGFYPQPADSLALASARTPTRVENPELWPEGWRRIGLRPSKTALYCTYMANAGAPGQSVAGLRFGSVLLGGQAGQAGQGTPTPAPASPPAPPPTGPWFYALAACNLDGPPGYPEQVTIFGLSSQSGTVQVFNDGR